MRGGGCGGERGDLAEHDVGHGDVDHEHDRQHRHVGGHDGRENADGADDGDDGGQQREQRGFHEQRVGGHELRGLADERAAETVGVEGHGLVGERVEAEACEVVVAVDLGLEDGVVLELRADLADHVHQDEGDDVGAEDFPDLVGADRAELDAIDDERHDEGVRVGEHADEADGGDDAEREGPGALLRDLPEKVERALDGGGILALAAGWGCGCASGVFAAFSAFAVFAVRKDG